MLSLLNATQTKTARHIHLLVGHACSCGVTSVLDARLPKPCCGTTDSPAGHTAAVDFSLSLIHSLTDGNWSSCVDGCAYPSVVLNMSRFSEINCKFEYTSLPCENNPMREQNAVERIRHWSNSMECREILGRFYFTDLLATPTSQELSHVCDKSGCSWRAAKV